MTIKRRTDFCPNCGKGEIDRDPAKNTMGEHLNCLVCGVYLTVPADLNQPLIMVMARVGDGPFYPMIDEKAIKSL